MSPVKDKIQKQLNSPYSPKDNEIAHMRQFWSIADF